jgi:hypothetical protein
LFTRPMTLAGSGLSVRGEMIRGMERKRKRRGTVLRLTLQLNRRFPPQTRPVTGRASEKRGESARGLEHREGAMSEEKLKEAVRRINELRYRLEPVEQHWAWTAEQLHHSLNGLVSYLSSAREVGADAPPPASEDESGAAKVTDNPI